MKLLLQRTVDFQFLYFKSSGKKSNESEMLFKNAYKNLPTSTLYYFKVLLSTKLSKSAFNNKVMRERQCNRASSQQLKLVIEVRRFLAIGHHAPVLKYLLFSFLRSL